MNDQVVIDWIKFCFGEDSLNNPRERALRFLEEAVELVQSAGLGPGDVHAMADDVFSRDADPIEREFGGVYMTVIGLAHVHNFDFFECGGVEMRRCVRNTKAIREKHKRKINGSTSQHG